MENPRSLVPRTLAWTICTVDGEVALEKAVTANSSPPPVEADRRETRDLRQAGDGQPRGYCRRRQVDQRYRERIGLRRHIALRIESQLRSHRCKCRRE